MVFQNGGECGLWLLIIIMIGIGPSAEVLIKNQSSGAKSNTTEVSNHPAPKAGKLPPNAKVVGNYLLGKNIGQGTFGKVHLAMHIPTNQKVAIKIIDKKSMRPKDQQRVKNEIAILKQIRHRNIMHLYEIIQTEKSLLLVTEYLQRGELFRLIIRQKRLSESQACAVFRQLIAGVEYLHRNNIAHRDLKPQNILIDFDGQIKIIDFGLSSEFSKNKELTSFCGSPCYAAPEVIEGKGGYNPIQTDLWSCGVILFAMLCGHLPFCDTDTHTLYKKVLACSYKIPAHVSAAARDLIEGLLLRNPSKRMRLTEIQTHDWFNLVSGVPAYGIDREERLCIDKELVARMQQLNIASQKLMQQLACGELNRQTASYFIFMKKAVRDGQKVAVYIGDDSFLPSLIERDSSEIDSEVVVDSTEGPSMERPEDEVYGCGSAPVWFKSSPIQVEKEIDTEQLRQLLGGILSMIMGAEIPVEAKTTMTSIFSYPSNGSRINKLMMDKKENEFYGNNKNNKKGMSDLQKYSSCILSAVKVKPKQTGEVELKEYYSILPSKNVRIRRRTASKPVKMCSQPAKISSRPVKMYSQSDKTDSKSDRLQVLPKVKKSSGQDRIFRDIEKLIISIDKSEAMKMLPYLTFDRDDQMKRMVSLIKSKRGKVRHCNWSVK